MKRSSLFAFVLVSLWTWAGLSPGPAGAQLIKSPGPHPAEKSAVEHFLAAVSHKAGSTITAGAMKGDLPAALLALDGVDPAQFAGFSAQFNQAWKAYEARKLEVDKAIETAKEKKAAGDDAGAIAALGRVITAPTAKPDGTVKNRALDAGYIIPADAEHPALELLLSWTEEARDWASFLDGCVILGLRHEVQEKGVERLIWLASNQTFRQLPGSGDLGAAMNRLNREAFGVIDRARYSGLQCFTSLVDRDVTKVNLPDYGKVKPGQWLLLAATLDVSGTRGTAKREQSGETPYDCRDSKKIDRIDPSGKVIYFQDCKFKKYKKQLDLSVEFKSKLPEHGSGDSARLMLIGRVKKAGTKLELVDAYPVSKQFRDSFERMSPRTKSSAW